MGKWDFPKRQRPFFCCINVYKNPHLNPPPRGGGGKRKGIAIMKILAVIPARGGSKGVPGKNIKMLCGKPLIAWTIEEAKKSRYITRVIVSTDSEEIAEVAKKYGADVPFLRPKEISGDLATDVEFLTHAVNWVEREEQGSLSTQPSHNASAGQASSGTKIRHDIIMRLPPTSPLRTVAHIDAGLKLLMDSPEADSVRPIVESPKHPYKMWKVSADYLEPFLNDEFTGIKEAHNMPRQMFPKVYVQSGAFDIMRVKTLMEQNSTSGKKIKYIMMKPEESVNIDSMMDFGMAEVLMKERMTKQND